MASVESPRQSVQGADRQQMEECLQGFASSGREQVEQAQGRGWGPSPRSSPPPPGRVGGSWSGLRRGVLWGPRAGVSQPEAQPYHLRDGSDSVAAHFSVFASSGFTLSLGFLDIFFRPLLCLG